MYQDEKRPRRLSWGESDADMEIKAGERWRPGERVYY